MSVPGSVAVAPVVGVTGWVAGGAEVLVGLAGSVEGGAEMSVGLGADDPHPAASMNINNRRVSRVTVIADCRLMKLLFFMRQV